MTARTTYTGGQLVTAAGGANAAGFPAPVVFENLVDFSRLSTAAAQNDVVEALNIPANTLIQGVSWEVEGVEGAARNFAIGDGANTSGFIATTTANTLDKGVTALAVAEGTPNTIVGYSAGKFYSAADTIDILAVTSGGLTAAKIRIKAFGWTFG